MQSSPTFSDLLAQPGPSAPAASQDAAGGIMLKDQAKQVALTHPLQQARVRTRTSMERLKGLAMDIAKEVRGGL